MKVAPVSSDPRASFAASQRPKRFFDRGGTYDRLTRNDGLYARRLGDSLSVGTAPGAFLKHLGGAAARLPSAFQRSVGTGVDTTA